MALNPLPNKINGGINNVQHLCAMFQRLGAIHKAGIGFIEIETVKNIPARAAVFCAKFLLQIAARDLYGPRNVAVLFQKH
jgi:hypothetical protein